MLKCSAFPIVLLLAAFPLTGCLFSSGSWEKTLPSSSELGSTRGYRVARTIIHLHSPISYDACDAGNTHCLQDLRAGLCTNRVDFAFLTDHPNNMAKTGFTDLLLNSTGDQALSQDGNVIGNRITCDDSHQVQVMAGYEDQLMPIGMTRHLDPDPSVRSDLYTGKTPELVTRLKNETDAIVLVPHTESRSSEFLSTLGMDGIEVYNLHANVNPKMRKDYLGFDYFSGLFDLMVYWVDPYGKQKPDLAIMSFLDISPVYAQKWDTLIAQGHHVTGVGGNDSHQNFFPGIANDGDRVDSHRRLLRWVSNHYLVKEMTLADTKDAIRKGRGWITFEGFGTPVGMEFRAQNSSAIAEIGETLSYSSGNTSLHVTIPHLHPASPGSGVEPTIIIRIKKVDSAGTETLVASSTGISLDYSVKDPGSYRTEIAIIPLHLKDSMGFKSSRATREIPWIITNHIYIQ